MLCPLMMGCSHSSGMEDTEETEEAIDAGVEEEITYVSTAEEAADVLADRSEELGYNNALSELKSVSTNTSGEHIFYRLQQNYKGIPVYGQHVVYVTDADGKCLTITQNIRDIPEDFDITPTVDAETVDGYVNTYIYYDLGMEKINTPVSLRLTEEPLCIFYDTLRDEFHLAYQLDWNSYRFLIDAHTGQVVHHSEMVNTAVSTATLSTSGESFTALTHPNGTFILSDADNGIYFLNARKQTFYNIYSKKRHPEGLTLVTSPDNVFGNANDSVDDPENVEAAFSVMQQVHKYYKEALGEEGIPTNLMVVYNDSCGDLGFNSAGGIFSIADCEYLFPGLDTETDGDLVGHVSLGTHHCKNILENIDLAAHEYTHVVLRWNGIWNSSTEAAVMDEAFADIMGELIEAQITGTDPDWVFLDERDIANPANTRMPVSISDIPDMKEDTVHNRSTIISHIAYRMWNGMDGTESKKIPTEQLSELWCKALLMMPANADFLTCRLVLCEAANLAGLTFDQKDCIREAFDNAEIWYNPSTENAAVLPDFTVTAYDSDYEQVNSYTLKVEEVVSVDGPLLPSGYSDIIEVNSADPYAMHLDYGTYRFTFTPAGADEESLPYLVKVGNENFDQLALYYDDRCQGQITCIPYGVDAFGNADSTKVLPNVQIDIYSAYPRRYVADLNTGSDGTAPTVTLPVGEYIMNIWAEGYQPYQQTIDICYYTDDQYQIPLYEVPSTEYSTETEEPYFYYPELVTTQNDMDYGVYPFPKDFILEEFGYEGDDLYNVYDTDTYGYDQDGGQTTITTSNPYYWWWGAFDPSVEEQINAYIELLSQDPFHLELIYTKDMGDEWVYVYRYTGKHNVYPLNISGFVPDDAGEYHFAVDISKRADHNGRISLEVAAGYGLEAITPEILNDIRNELGYTRTSDGSENVIANESLDSGTCYFCHATVYATEERPIYHEQIVYCDACYAEMFGN